MEFVFRLLPPNVGAVSAVSVDGYLLAAATGLADAFFIRLAKDDPEFVFIAQGALPDVWFVFGAEAFGEGQ